MQTKEPMMYVKDTALNLRIKQVEGDYTQIEGEPYYKITHFDQMQPFLMSVVSSSDHWMYVSSKGSLSAGRINRENAIFPYVTDDKIHDNYENTGSLTVFLVTRNNKTTLWQPFGQQYEGIFNVERNLYKNVAGNKLIFEEINHDLNLQFRYSWQNSEAFGFVRISEVKNLAETPLTLNLLDGIQNLLAAGVDFNMQMQYSTLVDAYKKSELHSSSNIGIFYLSSIPSDRAEPSEGLKATVVWSAGLDDCNVLLSSKQINHFKYHQCIEPETDVRGMRSAYFVQTTLELKPREKKKWYIMADSNKDMAYIAKIEAALNNKKNVLYLVNNDIRKGTEELHRIVGGADGLQKTGNHLKAARHFANVMFNVMRGGIFETDQTLDITNFSTHVSRNNKKLLPTVREFAVGLKNELTIKQLIAFAKQFQNPDLSRLTYEYLPLYFSRRHGDPSRPWNRFNVKLKNPDASKKYYYEGNWRDIFQNWEALAYSFPYFTEGMIAKFVNSSTIDGYNPYRISSNGIDWEVIEPDNPWSFIGYWGDHQIIYLAKLLELSAKFNPNELNGLLTEQIFAFANVPYRIKKYDDIRHNPQDTIIFDKELDATLRDEYAKIGSDAYLVHNSENNIHYVTLTEKLLLTALTKLSNFVPDAGIWLNTQRPEWNDANNALVGNGVSMVTLYYLRRYLEFVRELLKKSENDKFVFSADFISFFNEMLLIFDNHKTTVESQMPDTTRKQITDQLGRAGQNYREAVYSGVSLVKSEIYVSKLTGFIDTVLVFLNKAIERNIRPDGLFHSYNLIEFVNESLIVKHLPVMLEGQVAVLSSGFLNIEESLALLRALYKSNLYRTDQNSFMLYPDKALKRFDKKNTLSDQQVEKSELLKQLLANKNVRIVTRDVAGRVHFNADLRNANDLALQLDKLPDVYLNLLKSERQFVLDIWEEVFEHKMFTGRSGTFFKYEGLGSIYWHMVSKLLLATGEIWQKALQQAISFEKLEQLQRFYRKIQDGIGVTKNPSVYGAFPTDPYSHTPAHLGAQQPGMTGQVKEDIISRFVELGLTIEHGVISFSNQLVEKNEYLTQATTFEYFDINNDTKQALLNPDTLAFTYCQVPIIYHLSNENRMEIHQSNGSKNNVKGLKINSLWAKELFERSGKIKRIDVFFEA